MPADDAFSLDSTFGASVLEAFTETTQHLYVSGDLDETLNRVERAGATVSALRRGSGSPGR